MTINNCSYIVVEPFNSYYVSNPLSQVSPIWSSEVELVSHVNIKLLLIVWQASQHHTLMSLYGHLL